jgi:2-succinyl-6-hydroxy-2,4-cyclohexadiene-1-carboxylate synthase
LGVATLYFAPSGDGAPLVMLHGYTQTGRLFGPFGHALQADHRLIAIDLPGHGGSNSVTADLPTSADLVAEVIAESTGGSVDVFGYSLGSRVGLQLALSHPELVRRLVVVGATGGIEDQGLRAARQTRDDNVARELENSGDVEAFLDRWLSAPMFHGLTVAQADSDERRRNTAAGLASSLRSAGTGTQRPLWDELKTLNVPMLALAGANDPRFIGHAVRLARTMPNAVCTVVPGAGHAAHLEQPELVARTVRHWLAATDISEIQKS